MEDFEDYLSHVDMLFTYQTPFKLVFDATLVSGMELKYVMRQARHMMDNEENTAQWMVRTSIIVPHPVAKALLKFLFYLKPPVSVVGIFSDCDAGVDWITSENP